MLDEKKIAKLIEMGFKRWTKGGMDRMYINAAQLGLVCEYYKTGNIRNAEFQGTGISNSEGYRMKSARTFIDVKTEEVYSDNNTLKQAAIDLLESVA